MLMSLFLYFCPTGADGAYYTIIGSILSMGINKKKLPPFTVNTKYAIILLMPITAIVVSILTLVPVALIVWLVVSLRAPTPRRAGSARLAPRANPRPQRLFDSIDYPRQTQTGTWRDDPITQPQRDFIHELGGRPSRGMSKGEAADLIDRLIQERDHREMLERIADSERSGREKEAAELRHIAASMSDKPEYKARKGTSKRTRDLREFQYVLARVFADDVIDPSEASEILDWLGSRKIESDDFRTAFRLLPSIASGSAVPVAGDIQAALLDCLRTLRARPAV